MENREYAFREGDVVRYEEKRVTRYMLVVGCDGRTVWGYPCKPEALRHIFVPVGKAALVPPVLVNPDRLRQFLRYEITGQDFCGEVFPVERIRAEEPYRVTPEDMLALVTRAGMVGRNRFLDEWQEPVHFILDRLAEIGDESDEQAGTDGYRFLPSERWYVYKAFDILTDWAWGNADDWEPAAELLRKAIALRDVPVPERAYPEVVKQAYVQAFESDHIQSSASPDELALLRQYLDELVEAGNRLAMHVKAYACYGGSRAYLCDWVTSRDLLLKLVQDEKDGTRLAGYANTLGYIFYYGRCTDGVPEYNKAFYWFGIGAAGGYYESRYKLADMFLHGYGVPQSLDIARDVVAGLYYENKKHILNGHADCKFADVALRMGGLAEKDESDDDRFDAAYFFYLQADYAIRMRMKAVDWYGDAKVAAGIGESIARVLPLSSHAKPVYTLHNVSLSARLNRMIPEGRLLEARLRRLKNGGVSMRVRVKPEKTDKHTPRLFLTVPEAHFCGMVDSITLKAADADSVLIGGKPMDDGAIVLFNHVEDCVLQISGMTQAELPGGWTLTLKKPDTGTVFRLASVCFGTSGKRYDYLCDDLDLKPGDRAVVLTDRGETEVTVADVFTRAESEMVLPLSAYKHILNYTQ